MKRVLALIMTVALAATVLVGCGEKPNAPAEGEVKVGLAVVSTIGKSKAATADAAGNAQTDSTVVALMLDSEGKIIDVKIDAVQVKMAFNNKGEVTTALDTAFPSKQEQGDAYGMRKSSSIGKEWNEQANFLADYVVGKTIDEVKAIPLSETTAPTGADLTSSVTIKIAGYIEAMEKAAKTAVATNAATTDKLGLGIITSISDTKNATAEAAGRARDYSHFVAVTVDGAGKITSALLDATQIDVAIDATGAITTDLAATFKTKMEKGAEYNMKASSGIGKEWNEQATALATYITGKTGAEVSGIALDDTTKPTAADLTSSVTIKIGTFIEAITEAVANAK